MSRELQWSGDVADWKDVSVESYQFVLEQAKERLEEVISEAQNFKSLAMKMLISYVAGLSGIAGYIFSNNNPGPDLAAILFAIVVMALSIYVFTMLFAIMATSHSVYKGSPPAEIFHADIFFNDPDINYKNLLENEIERIQYKIQRIQIFNLKSLDQYRSILKVSLILIALVVFAVFRQLFSVS